MATLGLTFQKLYQRVGQYLGVSLPGSSPTGTDLTLAKQYVNDGYSMFLMGIDPRTGRAHQWSFLRPTDTIVLWPTSNTYTFTGGTTDYIITGSTTACFYESMEGRNLVTSSGNTYLMKTYGSGATFTLATDPSSDAGDTITITADGAYGLPSDFGAMIEDPSFDEDSAYTQLVPRSVSYIRNMKSISDSTGTPRYYAILPRVGGTITADQLYDMLVYPTPGSAETMVYRYRIEPSTMSTDAEYPKGGAQHIQTILQAALSLAEQRENNIQGEQTALYEKMMAQSIDLDSMNKPSNLGPIVDGESCGVDRVSGIIEYD